MPIINFPPIHLADKDGFLALGGDLDIDSLLLAYSRGIFPWPISEEYPLAWFTPDPRGILSFEDLHISKSLQKLINKNIYRVEYNHDFSEVIKQCCISKNRKDNDTWITQEIIKAYTQLFYHGFAYCVEVYNVDNKLVAGLYGVSFGDYFSGESMFFLESNTSKIAVVSLMKHLKTKGIDWLDTQMVTPVLKTLGGKEIPRSDFLHMIEKANITSKPYVAGANRL